MLPGLKISRKRGPVESGSHLAPIEHSSRVSSGRLVPLATAGAAAAQVESSQTVGADLVPIQLDLGSARDRPTSEMAGRRALVSRTVRADS